MAQNLAFARGGTSSWADDDDADFQPLPAAPKLAQYVARAHRPRSPARRRDDDRRGGGYQEDRRGGYNDRRGGGYEDRRGGGYQEDRRGPRGGYEQRERGPRSHDGDYAERPKNPVPEVGPWKIFVGNLPFRVEEDELADFIGAEGIRDIRFPRDFETNRPKGFAYVEFDTKEHLLKALELDGQDLDGRQVKMDVAQERERDRKSRQKEGGFFDQRSDRAPSGDRPRESGDGARARPRLTLLPRSTSAEKTDSDSHPKPSIFGDAKPRDESVYLERKKARDMERKAKAKEAKEAKAKAKAETKAKAEASEAAGPSRKGSHDEAALPSSRKNSHDDAATRSARAGGRGRGDKPHGERRTNDGGRGRGGEGGRGRAATPSAKKDDTPPTSARKAEHRSKRSEPPTAKIAAPAPAKTTNAFGILDDDSDSD
ncbi:hypothetical protein BBJ28_00009388 [Nothophytophthora sp. Chile5]|nr:hypothetical protein BBJ28_00009388 [Nothophytophthora sp. Chile5]